MSNFDEFFKQLIDRDMEFVEALLGPTDEAREEILEYVQKEEQKKEDCIKKGQQYIPDWPKYEELTTRYEQAAGLSAKLVAEFETSLPTIENKEKENTPVLSEASSTSTTTKNSRPKRAAFNEASQMINKQANMKLTEKLRREDVSNTHIKIEKLSTTKNKDNKKKDDGDDDDIEIMPPPIGLPIKIKPNRRIKKERLEISVIPEDDNEIVDINKIKQETNTNRGSDVILQEPRVSLVDLTISTTTSSSVSKPTNDDSTRGTYVIDKSTKKKQLSEKRNRNYASSSSPSPSSSDENNKKSLKKRSKIHSNGDNMDANDTEQTHYDDAISDIVDVQQQQQINATFVAKSPILLNQTVVLEKHQQFVANIPDSLLTDDESDNDDEQKQLKYNTEQLKTSKQVFSAFEQSPVKKKVEAFEKLGASTTSVPVRVTRTKTRALEQQQQDLATNNVKEKAKFFSPLPTKIKQPTIKTAQTTIKTKAEENRQKHTDIAEKRNARLQQLMDERRRKREEKELKAQQQREAIERDKLKQLEEQEKLKVERHKRLLYEQEQKKIKLREEAERKRLLVKENALKEKQKQQQTLDKPKYLIMETPRLPTIDCYDSDEEDYRMKKMTTPSWCQDENLRRFQLIMSFGGEKIKNTFFSRKAQTVDLQALFQINNPKVLKRTSSAHWTKPPKYSILPTRFESTLEKTLETTNEEEEEIED